MLLPHRRMYLAAFLMDCAFMAGYTVVPFFVLNQLGGGAGMIGTISALQSIGYAAVSLVSAPFVRHARNGLHFALVGIAGYIVLFGLAPLLTRSPALYAVLSMAGCGSMGLVWPALWSWIGAEPDLALRAKRISNYNVSWSIGLTLGPAIAGPLYHAGYWYPFVGIMTLAGLVWLLVLSVPHEKEHFEAITDTEEVQQQRIAYSRLSNAHLYCAWCANFLSLMLVGACRSVYA
ncbi:MAG TPA: MFS transporter, partial [Candidatus Hydrogenedentes bacterium]|nr:MFS transporter [Candidatus Hydrogenedentota bacterium]